MSSVNILKHLLNDDESLANYLQGITASLHDVKRRIFLKERTENISIPDHFYRASLEVGFKGLKVFDDIFCDGLYNLANSYFEINDRRIYVQQIRQNEWQQIITYVPPLILQASFMFIKEPLTGLDTTSVKDYFRDVIVPNTKNTAIPSPNIPKLKHFVLSQKGFHDLHMHLNGSTETDVAWQWHLTYPHQVCEDFSAAFNSPMVKEQMEHESSLLTPQKYYKLLRVAQKIRVALFHFIFRLPFDHRQFPNHSSLFAEILDEWSDRISVDSTQHPFAGLVATQVSQQGLISVECLMYVLTLQHIRSNKGHITTQLFHFYLLILGLCNRLMVQQKHQNGFDEFQKLTLNGLREDTEKQYLSRFLQLQGNDTNYIGFLEGRFSPKKTEQENLFLLQEINKGWNGLCDEIKTLAEASNEMGVSIADQQNPELRLIAHFIKRPENKKEDIRHRALRADVWNKARVLALLKQNYSGQAQQIVGIDAASNEFDANPEVFAPAFRMLRRKGFRHFTYHAGEDFYHIISGLRAIYEAIEFTDMRPGDRIGHATAAGISAKQWSDLIGQTILIQRGEWLDNLLFVYHLVLSQRVEELQEQLPNIANEIHKYAYKIYKQHYSIELLVDAWLLRKYCPILWLHDLGAVNLQALTVFDDDEWGDIRERRLKYRDCTELIQCYHLQKFREGYEELIEIDTNNIFDFGKLERLQLQILKIMHSNEIIIETLPTSNVRIGIHKDYATYHLWNWIKWEAEGNPVPPIVIGTDDTGIFATNIYNEYANIYCYLINGGKHSHANAMEVIKRLHENSLIYKFR